MYSGPQLSVHHRHRQRQLVLSVLPASALLVMVNETAPTFWANVKVEACALLVHVAVVML
jgi:hypothetical protein